MVMVTVLNVRATALFVKTRRSATGASMATIGKLLVSIGMKEAIPLQAIVKSVVTTASLVFYWMTFVLPVFLLKN